MAASAGQEGARAPQPVPPFSTEMTEEEKARRDKLLDQRALAVQQHGGGTDRLNIAMCYAINDGVILDGHLKKLRDAHNELVRAYQILSVGFGALAARVAALEARNE